jgi:hypothetical protein
MTLWEYCRLQLGWEGVKLLVGLALLTPLALVVLIGLACDRLGRARAARRRSSGRP